MLRRGTSAQVAAREWAIVCEQIKKNKVAFAARLERHLKTEGECRIWTAARSGGSTGKVYPTMTFRHQGKHYHIRVHRIFLMLKLGKPIPEGMEAGHFLCYKSACVVHVEPQTPAHNRKLQHAT